MMTEFVGIKVIDGISVDFDAIYNSMNKDGCPANICEHFFSSSKVDLGLAKVLSLTSVDTLFQVYKAGSLLAQTHDESLLANYYGDPAYLMFAFAVGPDDSGAWPTTSLNPRKINWKCFSKKIAKADQKAAEKGEYLHITYYDQAGQVFSEKNEGYGLDIDLLGSYIGVLHGVMEYLDLSYNHSSI